MPFAISPDLFATENRKVEAALAEDYAVPRTETARGASPSRRNPKRHGFAVAVPTWGVGNRRHPLCPFPRRRRAPNIFDKLEDCGVTASFACDTQVSPHFPWDNGGGLPGFGVRWRVDHGLGFDAVNSNTFQDRKARAAHTSSAP